MIDSTGPSSPPHSFLDHLVMDDGCTPARTLLRWSTPFEALPRNDLFRMLTGVRADLSEWSALSVKVGRVCRFERSIPVLSATDAGRAKPRDIPFSRPSDFGVPLRYLTRLCPWCPHPSRHVTVPNGGGGLESGPQRARNICARGVFPRPD